MREVPVCAAVRVSVRLRLLASSAFPSPPRVSAQSLRRMDRPERKLSGTTVRGSYERTIFRFLFSPRLVV